MKKLLIFMLIFVLALSIGVSATAGAVGTLSILPTTTAHSANVSDSVSATFKINNTGTTNLTGISISKTEFNSSSAKYTIPVTKVSLDYETWGKIEPSETPEFRYTIVVPNDAFADTYTGKISAKDSTGNNHDQFTVTLNVEKTELLASEDINLQGIPGQALEGKMLLTNNGNADSTIAVEMTDAVSGSNTIVKNAFVIDQPAQIKYKESGNVSFKITIPAGQTAGQYESTVTVKYASQNVTSKLRIAVQDINQQVAVTSAPATINWARTLTTTGNAKLKLKNEGNVDLTAIKLSLSDDLKAGSNSISKSKVQFSDTLNLAKGEEKEVTFTVSSVDTAQAIGEYSATIKAAYGDSKETSSTLKVNVRDPVKRMDKPSSVDLGGSSEKRDQTFSKSFTLTNSGDYTLSGLRVQSNAAEKYMVKFSTDNSNWETNLSIGSLSVGDTKTLYVQVYAPQTMDAGSQDIGDIQFTADDGFTDTISSFRIQTKSYLIIDDATIYVDGDDESLDDADTIDDVKPGAKIKIEFTIQNLFDDDLEAEEDMDIENIDVTVESDDDLGDDAVDETSDEIDLKPGKDETVTIEFNVDDDTDEGTYDFTVTVQGEDTEDAKHKEVWQFKLKVEKEDNLIYIAKAEFSDSTITCLKDTYLNILVKNLGQDDEDEARIKVTSSDLNIAIDNRDIELSNDVGEDDNEYSFSIPLDLEDFDEGTYKVTVETFYSDTKKSDSADVTLTIGECTLGSSSSGSSSGSNSNTGSIVIQTPTQGAGSSVSGSQTTPTAAPPVTISETTSASFRDSNAYFILLLAAVIVVAIALVTVVMKGMPPKYRY